MVGCTATVFGWDEVEKKKEENVCHKKEHLPEEVLKESGLKIKENG